MEACLELFQTDAVVGIQDMGAAGLTSSSFEMAGRAGSGVEIDLSKVPVREEGMTPYEIMLSESQERMLLVARARPAEGGPRDLPQVGARRRRDRDGDELRAGRPLLRGQDRGRPAGRAALGRGARLRPAAGRRRRRLRRRSGRASRSRPTTATACAGSSRRPNVAEKSWIWTQYDHMVGTNTVERPGGDAARRARQGDDEGARPEERRESVLLRARSLPRRRARRRRGGALDRVHGRAAARDHRLPELRQPREARGDGAVRGGGARDLRRLPRARDPGRVRQRLLLQRDGRPGDPADADGRDGGPARGRRASACACRSAARGTSWRCSERRATSSADRSSCARSAAATRDRARRWTSPARAPAGGSARRRSRRPAFSPRPTTSPTAASPSRSPSAR